MAGRQGALARLSWLLPAVCMAMAGLVRTTWPNLRSDELSIWGFAKAPWAQVWRLLDDLGPSAAPYHLALRAWAEIFGTSDFALRLPSVIAMTITAALLASLGTRLARPGVGFLAGMILVVVPTSSRYAQEVGPQALTMCLTTVSVVALVRVFDRPTFWRFSAYFVSVAALCLINIAALVVLVGHAVAVLTMRRGVILGWLAAAVLAPVPALTALYLIAAADIRLGRVSPAALADLVRLPEDLFRTGLIAGVVAGLGLLSWSLRRPGIIFTAWAVVPVLVLLAATEVGARWKAEHLLLAAPAWVLSCAFTLDRAPVVRGITVTAVIALLGLPSQFEIREPDGHGQASAALAAVIVSEAKDGDVIIYGPSPDAGRVGRDIVDRYVPSTRRPKDALALRPARTDGRILAAECADVVKCLAEAPRVWPLP